MLLINCVKKHFRSIKLSRNFWFLILLIIFVLGTSTYCSGDKKLSYLLKIRKDIKYTKSEYSASIRNAVKLLSNKYKMINTVSYDSRDHDDIFYISLNDVPKASNFNSTLTQLEIEMPDNQRLLLKDLILSIEVESMED